MLSLKKLLGKDDKFFDLLEAGAEEAKTSVDLFANYLKRAAAGSAPGFSLDEFIQTRRKEKRIRHTLMEELVERLSIYPGRVPQAAFARRAELMSQAADAVVFMVKQLRGGTTIEKI